MLSSGLGFNDHTITFEREFAPTNARNQKRYGDATKLLTEKNSGNGKMGGLVS